MFEIPTPKSNLKITVPLGAVVVMGMIAATVLVPRLWPATLSAREIKPAPLYMPARTGKPAPPHVKLVDAPKGGARRKGPVLPRREFVAPRQIPQGPPTLIVDPPDSFVPPENPGVPEGPVCANCIPGPPCPGCTGTDLRVAAPPPPVARPKPPAEAPVPEPPKQIEVGGRVQSAKLISQLKPSYPDLARRAGVQGVVRFTAVIGLDGRIRNLQLVSGHPLLVQAAGDSVKQWVYQPTELNGRPVEVITQIDVNFTLSR